MSLRMRRAPTSPPTSSADEDDGLRSSAAPTPPTSADEADAFPTGPSSPPGSTKPRLAQQPSPSAPLSETSPSPGDGPAVPPPPEEVRRDQIEDNYIQQALRAPPQLPPFQWKNILQELQWISFLVLTVTPLLALYGVLTTPLRLPTALWGLLYYFFSGLGITAGYHRLWAHRAYSAKRPLEYVFMLAGSSAVQGSIHWWARGHRSHHRYTDTDLDPYSASRGFFYSHMGWMLIKPRRPIGSADVSDLRRNPVVQFQHRHYLKLLFLLGFIIPTTVAGYGWGDWRGGFFYAGVVRLVIVHHATFCINSLAHWLGDATFDSKHSPRDNWITALVTVGEGYHNFHHQFPSDTRNGIRWYHYDPTKWLIFALAKVGLAYNLKFFPENEIRKGRLQMQLRAMHQEQSTIAFPQDISTLPIVTWDEFEEESKARALTVVAGIVHDVTGFMDDHPGGRALIRAKVGKDATTAFCGGVYDHSHAAQNLLATMRVGVIDGGYEMAKDKIAKLKARRVTEAADANGQSEATRRARAEAEVALAAARGQGEQERTPNKTALAYIAPGQAYAVTERLRLETNVVAAKNGNRIGKWW